MFFFCKFERNFINTSFSIVFSYYDTNSPYGRILKNKYLNLFCDIVLHAIITRKSVKQLIKKTIKTLNTAFDIKYAVFFYTLRYFCP